MSLIGECYILTNLVNEYKEANKSGNFLSLRKIKQLNRLCEKHVTLTTVVRLTNEVSRLMIENQKLIKESKKL